MTEEMACQPCQPWLLLMVFLVLLLMVVRVQDCPVCAWAGMHPAAIPSRLHLADFPHLQLDLPLESHGSTHSQSRYQWNLKMISCLHACYAWCHLSHHCWRRWTRRANRQELCRFFLTRPPLQLQAVISAILRGRSLQSALPCGAAAGPTKVAAHAHRGPSGLMRAPLQLGHGITE